MVTIMLSPRAKGFTLVEIIIVVSIIAILTAIAVPSYQSSKRKACRNDAKSTILEIVARQEKHYFQFNTYAESLADLHYLTNDESPEGCYTLLIEDCAIGGNCYQVTATAVGNQTLDTACASFTMNSIGQKSATGIGADPTEACW